MRTPQPTRDVRRCSWPRWPASRSTCCGPPATTSTRSSDGQRCRRPLALVDELRADGVPAVVSGAGPTVLAFTTAPDDAERLLARCPAGWSGHRLAVDVDGVRLA